MTDTETIRKLEELVIANRQILQDIHQLSFALTDLVTIHRKLLREASCVLTEKAISKALEDYENRKRPLSHRAVWRL